MKPYATFDRTQFPLIQVTFTGEKETPENFTAYLEGLHQNYDRQAPFALVFDATDAPTPNPSYQKKQADWMKTHDELIRTYCRGVAYVVPGLVLRNVLKLIFKMQRNPVPFEVFGDLVEGRKWAEAQLSFQDKRSNQ